ncbi:inosine/xanthosine triphosphatase [Paraferrimonas sp. SM1919]|uniref:inosine/xanthosine triphosphatase n=1 Tax=Paraferrimonas sp. SM1919 TaxID=2662263 RepID=UPI0013D0EE52|nr:inosine/xanthosine triphosphatase [Paraferrimonas sp. SM1919]
MALRIAIGSHNPVKIGAVESAFNSLYPEQQLDFLPASVPSLVSDQPMSEAETKAGAVNRAQNLATILPDCDFYVGLEGGVDLIDDLPFTFAYIAVLHKQQVYFSRSSALPLPKQVYTRLQQGEELGTVMDDLFQQTNIKQKGGAIGVLTKGHSSRQAVYTHTLLAAMAPISFSEIF